MKNKKVITIIGIVVVIAIVAVCLIVERNAERNLREAEKDLQETQEKYGWVEKETVDILVGKFNAQVVDNSSLNPASTDYLTVSDGTYSYGLITGIWLFIDPVEYKEDSSTEIVDYMTLYVKKSSEYADDSLEYAKHLIKANNSEITDTEIDELIKKAKATPDKYANNGKGLSVGYVEDEETYQYSVRRIYK